MMQQIEQPFSAVRVLHVLRVGLLWVLGCAWCTSGDAADKLWYLPPSPASIGQGDWLPQPLRVYTGTIVGFSEGQVHIAVADSTRISNVVHRAIEGERVVWVAPDWSGQGEAIEQALRDFEAMKYDACLQPMSQYVKGTPQGTQDRWRQLIVYGHLMYAAEQSGRFAPCLKLVSGFDQSSPPPYLLSLLPIAWTTPEPNVVRRTAAVAALADASPAVRLVAASWLLSGAERARAIAALRALENSDKQALIAQLASVVLWRTSAGDQVQASVDQWAQRVDRLPIALQAGAMTVIAERLRATGNRLDAKFWWLNVAKLGQTPGRLAHDAQVQLDKESLQDAQSPRDVGQ